MTAPSVLSHFHDPGHDHDHCLETALAVAQARCEASGGRLTPIRQRVLELIWAQHGPVKAYDLLDKLKAEHNAAAPPTVYRALDFLLAEGLIHRLESLNAFIGCGDPARPHPGQFLICRACQAVAELDDPQIGRLLEQKAAAVGFAIDNQTIELDGLCPACRA